MPTRGFVSALIYVLSISCVLRSPPTCSRLPAAAPVARPLRPDRLGEGEELVGVDRSLDVAPAGIAAPPAPRAEVGDPRVGVVPVRGAPEPRRHGRPEA